MNRVALGIAMFCAMVLAAQSPSLAQVALETTMTSARQYIERGQFKRAETGLRKAIEQATSSGGGQPDVTVARASVLLARACRQSSKYADAQAALEQAHNIYKTLGYVEPDYADEMKALSALFRVLDLASLGASSDALKNNGPVITMGKTDSGARVEIKLDAPYQNSLNNAKLDGLQLDKLVSFDIDRSTAPQIQLSNIKGFKIHSVEKNMWVNLLALNVGAADAEGKYDTQLTAGKAGITKTVPAKLPQKAYEPISGIVNQLAQFGTPVAMDLPVSQAPTNQTSQSRTESTQGPSTAESSQLAPLPVNPLPVESSTTSSEPGQISPGSEPTSSIAVPEPDAVSNTAPPSSSFDPDLSPPVQTKRPGIIKVGARPVFSPGKQNPPVIPASSPSSSSGVSTGATPRSELVTGGGTTPIVADPLTQKYGEPRESQPGAGSSSGGMQPPVAEGQASSADSRRRHYRDDDDDRKATSSQDYRKTHDRNDDDDDRKATSSQDYRKKHDRDDDDDDRKATSSQDHRKKHDRDDDDDDRKATSSQDHRKKHDRDDDDDDRKATSSQRDHGKKHDGDDDERKPQYRHESTDSKLSSGNGEKGKHKSKHDDDDDDDDDNRD